jgi:hypothetical protein
MYVYTRILALSFYLLVGIFLTCYLFSGILLYKYNYVHSYFKECNGTGVIIQTHVNNQKAYFDTECQLKNNEIVNVRIEYPFFPYLHLKSRKDLNDWLNKTVVKRRFYIDKIYGYGYNKKTPESFLIWGIILVFVFVITFVSSFIVHWHWDRLSSQRHNSVWETRLINNNL